MRAIYSIEGNIGSGKSTFLNLLKTNFPLIHVIPQPVAQWQHVSNRFNLLNEYYKDPHRWSFTFQINAILSRMKQLQNIIDQIQREKLSEKIYFSERSIVADRQIFAKLLFQQNKMNQMQYALYLQMFNSLESLFKTPRIHKFIYLRSSPQKCMERMFKRARNQENGILLEYLSNIHRLHEQWLLKNPNAMVIDGQQQFQTNSIRSSQMLKSVDIFLQH